MPLAFSQAALGFDVQVPTPWGDEPLEIPAGTQSGTVLRLRGKGLPPLNANGVGDLNVRIQLWTPRHLSDEQRRLFAELAHTRAMAPARTAASGPSSRKRSAHDDDLVADASHVQAGGCRRRRGAARG